MKARDGASGRTPRGTRLLTTSGFLLTFAAAWVVLDRLAPAPPMPLSALAAVVAAATVLVLGQVIVFRTPPQAAPRAFGLGRPVPRAVLVAVLVGGLVVATYLSGAAALDIRLQLRPQWQLVALGALLFHGLAEELVWRGFVFGRLRDRWSFWRSVAASMPLIALTHVPILLSSGPLIGGLALTSAAVTCLPLAYLWERGGRTVWAPAILHGLIGCWQVFERTYPPAFSLVVLFASIVVPLVAFGFRDSFFGRDGNRKNQSPTPASAMP